MRYPILPDIRVVKARKGSNYARREIMHIRPRDFDLSSYLEIVKPHLVDGFDHHLLEWAGDASDGAGQNKLSHMA
ncbi:hypothetical protein [Paracoccus saliphilus]|uniref:Uncharacterized protein n=1 Tax=Paracoccus saliphilus TaxID=405559 RepID=A0ABY7SA47_9RHOB|nr:hypothetical protein [Paracoccus saliphilus]WCR03883.1 hypothetical protein JHX88_03725 [Paracoccus saliphilus]